MRKLLMFSLLLGYSALAQQQFTLPELWAKTVLQSPILQQAQVQSEISTQEVKIQKSNFWPRLQISGAAQYVSEIAQIELTFLPNPIEAGVKERYDFSAGIQQLLFTGFRTKNLVQAARFQQAATGFDYQKKLQDVGWQVGVLYYQIQLNYRQQAMVLQAISRAEDQLRATKVRFRAAQVAAFDTLEASNRKLQLQSQISLLQNANVLLHSKLAALINDGKTFRVAEQQAVDTPQLLPNFQTVYQQALRNRPEELQLQQLNKAAEYQTNAQKSQFFPQIFGEVSYHYANPGVNFFKKQWMNYYTVGLGMQWQLWQGGKARHQVQQSKLQARKLQIQSVQLKLQIRQQVEEVLTQLKNCKTQIAFQKKLMNQERQRYQIVETAYRQGQVTILELRNAETALLQAELTLEQYLTEWQLYRLQLDFVTGSLLKQMQDAVGK
jgi:outer membrane protein